MAESVMNKKHESEVKVFRTSGINNCGGRCIINAHVKDGEVVKLTTDLSDGSDGLTPLCYCARGSQYIDSFLNGKRLRYPMKRIGKRGEGKFSRISWQEAVSEIVARWTSIRDTYGPGSRYVNYATGVLALLRGDQLAKRLLSLDGGFLDYYNSYSSACIKTATPYTYGTTQTGNSLDDWTNSKLIILWGHNPAETRFGTTMHYLRKAKEAGAKVVVVDPRFSDTAKSYADEWIGLKPGTDSALIDGMAYEIWSRGLHDATFLDRFCIGFDDEHMPEGIDGSESYLSYLTGCKDGVEKTPAWAEAITGVPHEKTAAFAVEYATMKPAALVQGYGHQRHANGEQSVRSGMLLACMTGNVGISGGWASGQGGVEVHRKPKLPIPPNPYNGRIPCFMWTDACFRAREMNNRDDGVEGVEALETDIKMIVNLAGNVLINQHSDVNRTATLLKDESKVEFILCSDLFMTPSAKFADILLPGTSMFENENITMPWAYGDYLLYNQRVIEPLYESRFEYDWLVEVAEGLGLGKEFTEGRRTVVEWLRHMYGELRKHEQELPVFDEFAAEGGHKYRDNPTVIAFKAQIEDPENNPFPTPSGKIELFSKRLYDMGRPDDIPAVPKYISPFEGLSDERIKEYPLQLIGWHTKRRTHSTGETSDKLEKIEKQAVWMNTEDAAARGISDGDTVEIWNDRGKIRIPVTVTGRIVKGAAAIPQGGWFAPGSDGADRRGSINVLTIQRPTVLAKGNPQHSALVQVSKAHE